MFTFMFAVLGSVVFWIFFFLVSFVVGSILLKHVAPTAWKTIKDGKRPYSKRWTSLRVDIASVAIAIVSVYLFWPFILVGIVFWFAIKNIICPSLRKIIISTASIIPEFEIKQKGSAQPTDQAD